MKRFYILGPAACLIFFYLPASAQPACDAVVKAQVEIAGNEFSLSDLLAPGSCPALRKAAAGRHLGAVPLPGSARVLEGGEVRLLVEQLRSRLGPDEAAWGKVQIPERVVVRHAGGRASCRSIASNLLATLPSIPGQPMPRQIMSDSAQSAVAPKPAPVASDTSERALEYETVCGPVGGIPENARLESMRAVWDSASSNWEISARCIDPKDCVPFLLTVRAGDPLAEKLHLDDRNRGSLTAAKGRSGLPGSDSFRNADGTLGVRPGEKVTLVWEQDGIRVVVPAVSLDGGGPGAGVRARIVASGRIVQATILSAGVLRTAL